MRTTDMRAGNPARLIVGFALPILLGNLFQQLYSLVDVVVVGHVLGDQALGAVGAAAPLSFLVIGCAVGATNGFSVVVARRFGAGDQRGLREVVAWSMVLTLVLVVALTLISVPLAGPALTALGTPPTILPEATTYLQITLAASGATFLYNLFAGLLRGVGNSVVPLVVLVVSSILNMVLDIWFVGFLGWGIGGAAWATAAAQSVAAMIGGVYFWRRAHLLHPSRPDFTSLPRLVADLVSMGLSMAAMLSVVAIGSIVLQYGVNSLGEAMVTAHTAARRVIEMLMLPMVTIGAATTVFISQNHGARLADRVTSGMRQAILLTWGWTAISIVVIVVGGAPLVRVISGSANGQVVQAAHNYLLFGVWFFLAVGPLFVVRNSLMGLGRKRAPLISSSIELVMKCAAVMVFIPLWGYWGVILAEPIAWIVCAGVLGADFALNVSGSPPAGVPSRR